MDLISQPVAPQPPENIVPLEVWGLILDHVNSPSDLLNCNQTCKAWKKVLELRKTEYLMPKVFPLLYNYLGPNKNSSFSRIEILNNDRRLQEEKEENAREKLSTALKMRLVSHSWKESVDTFLQDHKVLNHVGFSDNPYGVERRRNVVSEFPPGPYTFGRDNVAKLESWILKDFPPDCNPFITRLVVFKDRIETLDFWFFTGYRRSPETKSLLRGLKTSFRNMLEAFGSEIHTCQLHLTSCSNPIKFYRALRSYLILMPNLKTLDILNFNHSKKLKVIGSRASFAELFQKEPMPRLENLKKIYFYKIPTVVSEGILSQNEKLKKLCTDTNFEEGVLPELPNLEQLNIHPLRRIEINLGQFRNLVWRNLKALKLMMHMDEISLKDVFGAISACSFSCNLEYLILNFMGDDVNTNLEDIRLELPNLQKFVFNSFFFKLETIDFLERCTRLQEIDLDKPMPRNDIPSNSVIQFQECMQNSNIWQLLPLLKLFKVETREGKKYFTKGLNGQIKIS